jgi:hypothetical protein
MGKHIGLEWELLRQDDVACVRPFEQAEWKTGLKRQCLAEAPKPPPRAAANIAEYARAFLNCGPQSFDGSRDKALVFNFELGEPQTDSQIARWIGSSHATFRVVGADRLKLAELEGVRGDRGDEADPTKYLVSSNPNAMLWVLGFASVIGRPTLNQDLSERRARAVARQLYGQGLPLAGARGLGAGLMSGTNRPQQDAGEQIAVAFLCTPNVESAAAVAAQR